tara:strand:+ start:3695 stop:5398 length:1704 start_codon:yes stop_codon:yes gene_type:complete
MKKLREQSAESKKAARDIRVSDPNPFPNMSKWWMEPKEKLMSFVYYMKGQIPPHNKADYKKNWKKVVEGLQKQYPAPTEAIYKKKLNEAVLSGKSLLTENVKQKNSFPKFTKKELKEIRRKAAIKARVDEYVKHKAALLEESIMNTPSNKLKLQESSYSELKFGVSKVLNESNQHVGNKVSILYEGKRYDVDKLPKRKMLEAYINNRCNILMEGGELQPFMEQWWRLDKHVKKAANYVGKKAKQAVDYGKKKVGQAKDWTKKNIIDPGKEKLKQAGDWAKSNIVDPAKKGLKKAGDWASKNASKLADFGQDALMVGGMIPIVGNVFDAANTAWSAGRAAMASSPEARKKHLANMAVNAAAMIPGAGLAVGGAKLGSRIIKNVAPSIAKGFSKGGAKLAQTGLGKTVQAGAKGIKGAIDKGTDLAAQGIMKTPLGNVVTKAMTGPKSVSQYTSRLGTSGHVFPSRASMTTLFPKVGQDLSQKAVTDQLGKNIRTKLSKKIWTKGDRVMDLAGLQDYKPEVGGVNLLSPAKGLAKKGVNAASGIWDALSNVQFPQQDPSVNPWPMGPKI